MSLVYIVESILKKIWYFFKHWYVDGFWFLYRQYIFAIKRLDRRWSLLVTVRNMFKPLYQDYTFAGYFIGIGFRMARSLIASFVYLIISVVFVFVYCLWAMILPVLVFKTFN